MKTRIRFFAPLVWIALASTVFAQSPREVGPPFLWKASSETATVWIFGTIHVGNDAMFPLDARVEAAIAESARGVVEISPEEMERFGTLMLAHRDKIFMPQGKSSLDYLTPENRRALKQIVSEVELVGLGSSQPWVVVMYVLSQEANRLGYVNRNSVDQYVVDRFVKHRKRVLGLETASFQLEILSSAELDLQGKMLNDTIGQLEDQRVQLHDLIEAYRSRDEAKLVEILEDSRPNESEAERAYYESILDRRNEGMANSIAGYLREENAQTTFVAVGCAHLFGPKGIPELLKEGGVSVQRVR